jgi:hypothetical protein
MSRRSSWIAVAVAIVVVVILAALMSGVWTSVADVGISAAGWFALVLGVLATLALGIGLMALVFISSRRGYDEGGPHGR